MATIPAPGSVSRHSPIVFWSAIARACSRPRSSAALFSRPTMPVGAGRARAHRLISIPPLAMPSCNAAATSLCCAELMATLPPPLVTRSCRMPSATGVTSTATVPVMPWLGSPVLIAVCILLMKPGRSGPCAKVTGIAGWPSTEIRMLRVFAGLVPKRCSIAVKTSASAGGNISPESEKPATAAAAATTCAGNEQRSAVDDGFDKPPGCRVHAEVGKLLQPVLGHGASRADKAPIEDQIESALRIGRVVIDLGSDQIAVFPGIVCRQPQNRLARLVVQRHRSRVRVCIGDAHNPGGAAAVQEELPDLRPQFAHAGIVAVKRLELPQIGDARRRAEAAPARHSDKRRDRCRYRRDRMGAGELLVDINAGVADLDRHDPFPRFPGCPRVSSIALARARHSYWRALGRALFRE